MENKLNIESRERIIAGAKKSAEIQKQRKAAKMLEYYACSKKCSECKNTLPYEKRSNKFCGSSCSARNSNVTRGLIVFCKFCNKKLRACDHRKTGKYCSSECYQKSRWQKIKEYIETTGKSDFGIQGLQAKRFLKETRGRKCEICGLSEWNGKEIPIVLDHINGHAEDWSITNLRLLCCNCDAQTPTYKSKNKGNGRHARRQRYAEGKSY